MKNTTILALTTTLALALTFTTGCTTLTEAELEQREYQRVERQARIEQQWRRCDNSGGTVRIVRARRDYGTSARRSPLGTHDSWWCE